jgi:hypothetical protein
MATGAGSQHPPPPKPLPPFRPGAHMARRTPSARRHRRERRRSYRRSHLSGPRDSGATRASSSGQRASLSILDSWLGPALRVSRAVGAAAMRLERSCVTRREGMPRKRGIAFSATLLRCLDGVSGRLEGLQGRLAGPENRKRVQAMPRCRRAWLKPVPVPEPKRAGGRLTRPRVCVGGREARLVLRGQRKRRQAHLSERTCRRVSLGCGYLSEGGGNANRSPMQRLCGV